MATVTVREETFPAGPTDELTLDFLTERVTVRELIRGLVYQTVTEQRAKQPRPSPAAFQPAAAEQMLNGVRVARQRGVDWEQEYARVLLAFQRGAVLLLVDDQQVSDLDAEIELLPDTGVTFLRLIPLAGG
jgi:hypothetical protein